jgi:hypothetical protein
MDKDRPTSPPPSERPSVPKPDHERGGWQPPPPGQRPSGPPPPPPPVPEKK